MNETHESADPIGDELVEARIAAWVLGESSAVEAADLERLCEQRPELDAFRFRLQALHGLLSQAESTGPDHTWKLPPGKRRVLDKIFDEKSPAKLVEKRRTSKENAGLRVFFAIAACLLFAAVVLQITSRAPSRGSMPVAFQHNEDAPLTAKRRDEIYGVDSMAMSKNRDLGLQETARQRQLAAKQFVASPAEIIAAVPATAPELAASTSRSYSEPELAGTQDAALGGQGTNLSSGRGTGLAGSVASPTLAGAESSVMNSVAAADSIAGAKSRAAQEVPSPRIQLGDPTPYRKSSDEKFRDSSRRTAALGRDARFADRVGTMAPASVAALSPQTPSPEAPASRFAVRGSQVEPMEELLATEHPHSTFPLRIGDASFQLAKAALAQGIRPDPATVRLEHFYNAVDYGDAAPNASESVAVAIDQATHPFLPGRNLVRLALSTRSTGRSALEPLHLTLLVDQSGSLISGEHRPSMVRALKQLTGLLTKNDLVTVVGFSNTPHLLADGLSGDQFAKCTDFANLTGSGGEANLRAALKFGGEMAARHRPDGAQNRIVLFADGSASVGNADSNYLVQQVKALRQQGIAFDIADTRADGSNDGLLGELARAGNGRYYLVGGENPTDFASQLAGALRPAAENLEVQVKFNAQRIGKYKLLGFEQDRPQAEHSPIEAVDAVAAARAESGVAIYQVELLPGGSGEIGEVTVRYRDTTRGEGAEQTWEIPYHSQPTPFDRAAPSMQLAGLALFTAEKLRCGPAAASIDFHQLSGPISQVKQFYSTSPRVGEMLEVIEKLK